MLQDTDKNSIMCNDTDAVAWKTHFDFLPINGLAKLFYVIGLFCVMAHGFHAESASLTGITSISPSNGTAAANVTISWAYITAATLVRSNGVAAASHTVVSSTSITAVAPAGVTTGKISVTTSGGTATSASSFTVVAVPTITSFTPIGGVAATSATITGANFTGATAAKFKDAAASTFRTILIGESELENLGDITDTTNSGNVKSQGINDFCIFRGGEK